MAGAILSRSLTMGNGSPAARCLRGAGVAAGGAPDTAIRAPPRKLCSLRQYVARHAHRTTLSVHRDHGVDAVQLARAAVVLDRGARSIYPILWHVFGYVPVRVYLNSRTAPGFTRSRVSCTGGTYRSTVGIRHDIEPQSIRSRDDIAIPVAGLEVRHRSAHLGFRWDRIRFRAACERRRR